MCVLFSNSLFQLILLLDEGHIVIRCVDCIINVNRGLTRRVFGDKRCHCYYLLLRWERELACRDDLPKLIFAGFAELIEIVTLWLFGVLTVAKVRFDLKSALAEALTITRSALAFS